MLFFDRRKGNDKRAKKDQRGFDNLDYNGPENRNETERRKNKDRRSGTDREVECIINCLNTGKRPWMGFLIN